MPAVLFVPNSHVTIAYDEPITIYSTDPNWERVVELLHEKDYDSIREMMNKTSNALLSFDDGRLSIDGGVVFLDDKPVEGTLVERLIEMCQKALDIKPIAQFIANVHDNPNYDISEDAYGFVEGDDLPITSDGQLLAYQRIRRKWTDIGTSTLDLSIGSVAENVELSFCGRKRLAKFFGHWDEPYRTIVIKINPRDITKVPTEDSEGVCSRYEVVGEVEEEGWKVEGAYSDDYDDTNDLSNVYDDMNDLSDVEAYPQEGEEVEDEIVFDFGSALIGGYKEFSTKQEAMEYAEDNPGYNVRDRGPDRDDRWYVSPPDSLGE